MGMVVRPELRKTGEILEIGSPDALRFGIRHG
jgi:hypothetical protein